MRTTLVPLTLLVLVGSGAARAERLPPMPLHFIRNVGQTDPAVGWLVKGAGPDIYFASEEIVLREAPRECGEGAIVRLRFEGASPSMRLEPLEALPGVAHFYLGNDPAAWRENVPLHAGVAYRDAWPGIDAIYRGTDGRLKAEFEVAPGADERQIRLAFAGVTSLDLRKDGALVLTTATGELLEEAPETWEEGPFGRRALPSRFTILGPDRVGFVVDGRDPSAKLVVDPVLDYSSYVGGSGEERVTCVGGNSDLGLAWIAGSTTSPDFPASLGAPPTAGVSWDAVYAWYDLTTGMVISTTFLGGTADDFGTCGGGTTFSADLPVTAGAPQPGYGGNGDAFTASVMDDGRLASVSYLGGSARDELAGSVHDIWFGRTWSVDFPLFLGTSIFVRGPFDRTMNGPSDGFVSRREGTGLVTTFVGGSGDDAVTGAIDLASADQLRMIGGWTESADFPRGPAPGWDSTLGGTRDGFVLTFRDVNSVLDVSTLVGGSGVDEITALGAYQRVPLGDDRVAVGGMTDSSDFPLHRALQPAPAGDTDAFVTVLARDLGSVHFSSTFGGGADDSLAVLSVTAGNVILVGGTTASPDLTLVRPLQAALQGSTDAFAARLNVTSDPPRVEWSTYVGSPGADVLTARDVHGRDPSTSDRCLHLGGTTDSDAFPTHRAVQPLPGGGGDGFLARLCETDVLAQRDPAEQLVEVLERLERIESSLDLSQLRESLARIEGCCDTAQGKLDDLLDFADDATARLDAIEDLLERLAREQQDELLRDIETSLFARQCVPWLWLPEDAGHLRLAREHVARRLEEALASADPGVNEGVARARLDAADREMAASAWQDGCKRLSDALHALTSP